MYLIVIAWLYVVFMMAVAEATNTTGTLLGAFVTFVLYGALPVALIVYFMGTPARRKRNKALHRAEWERQMAARATHAAHAEEETDASTAPDAGSHSTTDAIASMGEKK